MKGITIMHTQKPTLTRQINCNLTVKPNLPWNIGSTNPNLRSNFAVLFWADNKTMKWQQSLCQVMSHGFVLLTLVHLQTHTHAFTPHTKGPPRNCTRTNTAITKRLQGKPLDKQRQISFTVTNRTIFFLIFLLIKTTLRWHRKTNNGF